MHRQIDFRRLQRCPPALIGICLAVSLSGLGISVWAHVEALTGRDPGLTVHLLWVVPLVLLLILIAPAAELFLKQNPLTLTRSPRWMQVALYVLLGYYVLNFFIFIYWSVDHLDSCATWRMFSSGWLLLFGTAAVFYHLALSAPSNIFHE